MAPSMQPTLNITAIAMNALDASGRRLQSAPVEASAPIHGVRELEEAMAAAPEAPRAEK